MDTKIIEKKWTDIAVKQLVGRRITGVRYMTDEERREYYWSNRALIVTLDNGQYFIPTSDPEGNNAGTLHTSDEKEPVLTSL